MKRVIGSIFIVLSFIMFFMQIKGCIVKDYEYQNKIEYAWNLADKSSTLSEKSKYIEEFVTNIKKEKFADNNAIIFKTKDNSFEYNLTGTTKEMRKGSVDWMNIKSISELITRS